MIKCLPLCHYLFIFTKLKKIYTMNNESLMRRAIALSEESVRTGGGPFGAVIAKDGVVIAEASNSVTMDNDPTAVSYTHLTLPTN